jgi:hypothetical protein
MRSLILSYENSCLYKGWRYDTSKEEMHRGLKITVRTKDATITGISPVFSPASIFDLRDEMMLICSFFFLIIKYSIAFYRHY